MVHYSLVVSEGGKRVPNHRSAEKALRVAERRRLENVSRKSAMRTASKKFRLAVAAGQKEQAQALLREAISKIDRAAAKRAIHPRQADRRKSRLMKAFQALA